MYITQHLSFQDQLHSLTPIAHQTKKKQKKTKKQKKKLTKNQKLTML